MTPRPDHAEHVDHRQTHQGDEQCFLGKSRALAGVVEPQRLEGDSVAQLGRFPKPVPLPALTSTTTALFSVGIIVASVSTPGLDPECLTVSLLGSRDHPNPYSGDISLAGRIMRALPSALSTSFWPFIIVCM